MIFLIAAISFVAAFVVTAGLTRVEMIPWQRAGAAHWTERARELFTARKAATLNVWLVAANIAITWQALRGEDKSSWVFPAVAAWFGAALSGFFMDRKIWPGVSFKRWFGQFILYGAFLQIGLLLMVVGISLMPPQFNTRALAVAGGIFVVILALTFGLTMVLLRWVRVVKPAPARADEIARRVTTQAGARLNRTWMYEGPAALAFALMPMNDLLFSDTLLRELSEEELASICAHEAAHLTESKWVFAARLVGAFLWYPLIFITPAITGFGFLGALLPLTGTILLLMIYRRVARQMEKRADAAAATQSDPAIYARALEKLYELNAMPAVMSKRAGMVHPDLYDRMLAAGVTPAYERPKPPTRRSWTAMVLYIAFIFQVVLMVTMKKNHERNSSYESIPGGAEKIHLGSDVLTNNSGANLPRR